VNKLKPAVSKSQSSSGLKAIAKDEAATSITSLKYQDVYNELSPV